MNENQKVIEGNCFEVMQSFDDNSIDMICTDPPYSLGYTFEGDSLTYIQQSQNMQKYMQEFYRILKEGGVVAIFMSQEMSHYLYFAGINAGLIWQNQIIWNRDGGQMPTKKFGICHEVITIFSKNSPSIFNLDDLRVKSKYAGTDKRLNPKGKNPGDVWYVPALFGKKLERLKGHDGKAAHPTQKPLDIVLPLILAYTNVGDLVLDPFSGVGTTATACSILNRSSINIEINPDYVRATKERLNDV